MPYENLAERDRNQFSSPSETVRICCIPEVIRLVCIEVNGVIRNVKYKQCIVTIKELSVEQLVPVLRACV